MSITKHKKIIIVNKFMEVSIEMKIELPTNNFFDGFYIWFNKDKKEEYYSTPLYLYGTNREVDYENRLFKIEYTGKEPKNKTKQEEGLKYPGNTYCPYVERFGMFLLRFLNSNLETYQSAYETFFSCHVDIAI